MNISLENSRRRCWLRTGINVDRINIIRLDYFFLYGKKKKERKKEREREKERKKERKERKKAKLAAASSQVKL